jgi:hypothetical protein
MQAGLRDVEQRHPGQPDNCAKARRCACASVIEMSTDHTLEEVGKRVPDDA